MHPHHITNNLGRIGSADILLNGMRMTARMKKEKSVRRRKRIKRDRRKQERGRVGGRLSTRERVNVGG